MGFASTLGLADARACVQVRYSFVITPVNYSLAAVNFFVGSTGLAQMYRIWDHQKQNPTATKIAKAVHS